MCCDRKLTRRPTPETAARAKGGGGGGGGGSEPPEALPAAVSRFRWWRYYRRRCVPSPCHPTDAAYSAMRFKTMGGGDTVQLLWQQFPRSHLPLHVFRPLPPFKLAFCGNFMVQLFQGKFMRVFLFLCSVGLLMHTQLLLTRNR